jgi:hypothetical protein
VPEGSVVMGNDRLVLSTSTSAVRVASEAGRRQLFPAIEKANGFVGSAWKGLSGCLPLQKLVAGLPA